MYRPGGSGGLFIKSSFIAAAMTDIHHPTLNLPDLNLPPQSEKPEFPRIGSSASYLESSSNFFGGLISKLLTQIKIQIIYYYGYLWVLVDHKMSLLNTHEVVIITNVFIFRISRQVE